jgi:hypothetical protein
MVTKRVMSSTIRAIWFGLIGLTYHKPFGLHVPNTGDKLIPNDKIPTQPTKIPTQPALDIRNVPAAKP